jgi:hypothetical protein
VNGIRPNVKNICAEYVDCQKTVKNRDEERAGIENVEQKQRNKKSRGRIELQCWHAHSRLCNYPRNTRLTENVYEMQNVGSIFLLNSPPPLCQT